MSLSGGLLVLCLVLAAMVPILVALAQADARRPARLADDVCLRCGSVDGARQVRRGSLVVEVLLWLMWLLPGLIYTAWRWSTLHAVCVCCGAAELVPVDSPRGRQLMRDHHPHVGPPAGD